MTRYILYCSQEANFQTRSMLIPYDLIMKCQSRVEDLQVLRDNCCENVKFIHREETFIIDQLLIQDFCWESGSGHAIKTKTTVITNALSSYAEGWDPKYPMRDGDEIWCNDIIYNVASQGFCHIGNYCSMRNASTYDDEPIEVVEGFLVLESRDGEIEIPMVDTVEEIFKKYYDVEYTRMKADF